MVGVSLHAVHTDAKRLAGHLQTGRRGIHLVVGVVLQKGEPTDGRQQGLWDLHISEWIAPCTAVRFGVWLCAATRRLQPLRHGQVELTGAVVDGARPRQWRRRGAEQLGDGPLAVELEVEVSQMQRVDGVAQRNIAHGFLRDGRGWVKHPFTLFGICSEPRDHTRGRCVRGLWFPSTLSGHPPTREAM
jgi:hypothetical protein